MRMNPKASSVSGQVCCWLPALSSGNKDAEREGQDTRSRVMHELVLPLIPLAPFWERLKGRFFQHPPPSWMSLERAERQGGGILFGSSVGAVCTSQQISTQTCPLGPRSVTTALSSPTSAVPGWALKARFSSLEMCEGTRQRGGAESC